MRHIDGTDGTTEAGCRRCFHCNRLYLWDTHTTTHNHGDGKMGIQCSERINKNASSQTYYQYEWEYAKLSKKTHTHSGEYLEEGAKSLTWGAHAVSILQTQLHESHLDAVGRSMGEILQLNRRHTIETRNGNFCVRWLLGGKLVLSTLLMENALEGVLYLLLMVRFSCVLFLCCEMRCSEAFSSVVKR